MHLTICSLNILVDNIEQINLNFGPPPTILLYYILIVNLLFKQLIH